MGDLAIRVQDLGKQYALYGHAQPGALLADQIALTAKRMLRTLTTRMPRGGAAAPATPTGFWALRGVGFDVQHGEVVGVIGRNGAGKSTLLRILSRITPPTTGRAELFGRVGALLEVGTGFHPELTGRENIFMNGAILGMRRREISRKFDEIVAFAEVERFIDTPVKFYSTGMRVRLGFAVAAHLETEILLMDEVLAVGDAAFQQKCLGKMGDVARAGRTVIFVSHDLTAIQVLCQRAIRLSGGAVQGVGPVSDEIAAYLADVHQASAHSGLKTSVELSPRLRLVDLQLEPVPVVSGGPAHVRVGIDAVQPTRVDGVAIAVHDSLHRRIGLIDLRQPDGPYQLGPDRPLRLRISLSSLPLVEGEYHAGLVIESDDFHGRRDDLISFGVVAPPEQTFVPYARSSRGVVAFDYRVEAH